MRRLSNILRDAALALAVGCLAAACGGTDGETELTTQQQKLEAATMQQALQTAKEQHAARSRGERPSAAAPR
jgi:hypothetical protein